MARKIFLVFILFFLMENSSFARYTKAEQADLFNKFNTANEEIENLFFSHPAFYLKFDDYVNNKIDAHLEVYKKNNNLLIKVLRPDGTLRDEILLERQQSPSGKVIEDVYTCSEDPYAASIYLSYSGDRNKLCNIYQYNAPIPSSSDLPFLQFEYIDDQTIRYQARYDFIKWHELDPSNTYYEFHFKIIDDNDSGIDDRIYQVEKNTGFIDSATLRNTKRILVKSDLNPTIDDALFENFKMHAIQTDKAYKEQLAQTARRNFYIDIIEKVGGLILLSIPFMYRIFRRYPKRSRYFIVSYFVCANFIFYILTYAIKVSENVVWWMLIIANFGYFRILQWTIFYLEILLPYFLFVYLVYKSIGLVFSMTKRD